MEKPDENIQLKNLIEVLSKIKDRNKYKNFLEDLCTPKEIKSLADRLEVAQLIQNGTNYREISGQTGASTATITRVGRALKYGPGGYSTALKIISKKDGKK